MVHPPLRKPLNGASCIFATKVPGVVLRRGGIHPLGRLTGDAIRAKAKNAESGVVALSHCAKRRWYQDVPDGALSLCTVTRSRWISMPPQDSQLARLVRKARHAPSRVGSVPGSLRRFARALATHPIETLQYIPEAVSSQLFDKQVTYDVEDDYGAPFHQMLGVPWPCGELDRFHQVWADIERSLLANGLSFGRWTYGEYSDADQALGAATWCAVRHNRPTTVLETGVARGVTSRIILEALSLNGNGHLWSLDLPHPFRPELHKETAAAVPTSCRDRWTYIRGSSRRQLPSLVSRLKKIDMFVHDSLHTGRNMRFELKTVWPAMHNGDLALVDDVDNQSFRDFVQAVDAPPSIVMRSADGPWMFGAIKKDAPAGSRGRLATATPPSRTPNSSVPAFRRRRDRNRPSLMAVA
jgi:hypothetical protein